MLLTPLLAAVTRTAPGWYHAGRSGEIAVESRAALHALAPLPGMRARLRHESDAFVFQAADGLARVTADTVEGMFIRSAHVSPEQGFWARVFEGAAEVAWFARDGVRRDDTSAINSIAALLQLGAITSLRWDRALRYADTSGRRPGAVTLLDVSNVLIDMTGGSLVMANLQADGTGSGSGFWFGGSCHDCTLVEPTVVWDERPRRRSRGDGITVKSRPGASWASRRFQISGTATIRRAPQAGVIFMGCDRPRVDAVNLEGTLADGLHFNACRAPAFGTVRHLDVERWEHDDTGDDAVAFVTYAADAEERAPADWKTVSQPWARPALDEWSNTGARGKRIESVAGRANALRISGARAVTIEAVQAFGKAGAALVVDSAEALGPGASWRYRASRDIHIGTVEADDCTSAVQVISRYAASADYRQFDLRVASVRCRDAGTHAMAIDNASGVTVESLSSERSRHQALFVINGGSLALQAVHASGSADQAVILQGHLDGITFGTVETVGGDLLVNVRPGAARGIAFDAVTCRTFQAVGSIEGLTFGSLRCIGGTARFQADPSREGGPVRIRRVRLGTLALDQPVMPAVVFADVEGLDIPSLVVNDTANASGTTADHRVVVLDRVTDADIRYTLAGAPGLTAVALGGGVGTQISRRIRILLSYPGPDTPVVLLQKGALRPRDVNVSWRSPIGLRALAGT